VWSLTKADLSYARLNYVDLAGSQLLGTILNHALLTEVDLAQACIINGRLEGAKLIHVDLTGSNLTNGKLIGTMFAWTTLIATVLTEVTFSEGTLHFCNVEGMDVTGARLNDIQLMETDLSGAKGVKLDSDIFIDDQPLPPEEGERLPKTDIAAPHNLNMTEPIGTPRQIVSA